MQNKIVLGGGCFWCLEAVYQKVTGIISLTSGYAGGDVPNPSYEEVSSGKTNHAEVVEIVYDPAIIKLESLLEIFFEIHDSTTLNQQGADSGTQYRSAIYYTSPEDLAVIKEAIMKKQMTLAEPIVTEVKPLDIFYKAEEYHQNYYQTHPDLPYCTIIIAPKLQKFFEKFGGRV